MKKMKAITLAAVIFALIFALAACGSGSNNDPSAANDNNPKKEDNANEENNTPKINLNGETLRFAAWWDATPKADSELGELLVAKKKEIEKKYNVKIQYDNIPYDELKKKITSSILSGEPFADVIRMEYSWAFPSMVENGQLIALEDLTNVDESKVGKLYKNLNYKGKHYIFDGEYADGAGWYYNRTLFKKLGLQDLHEIVDANEWTWDKMEEIAKQATQDTNGDGKIDTWGLAAYHEGLAFMLATSNGAKIVDEDTGKEGITDPKTIEALNFLSKLFNEDKVVRYKNAGDWGEQRKLFPEGNVAMVPGWTWEGGERMKDMKDIDWGYVPFPKGPQMGEYVAPFNGLNGWFIPKGSKHAQEVFQIWQELNDVGKVEDYPGQTWYEQSYKHEDDIETAKMVSQLVVIQNYGAYPDYPFWGMVDDIVKNHTPVATAVEKVKLQAQAKVDAVLKK